MFLSFCGKFPRDEGAVFVAPNATVQGDVVLKAGSTVWYGAVLRGDDGQLIIGENSNVQDNAVLHCDVGGAVTLGKNVTVGHSALVHGCTVAFAATKTAPSSRGVFPQKDSIIVKNHLSLLVRLWYSLR